MRYWNGVLDSYNGLSVWRVYWTSCSFQTHLQVLMGFSGLGLCLSAESDWTGHFLDWKQILLLFCAMYMLFVSPFFSYTLTGAGWTFLGCFGKAGILSCRWGVGPGSVCFRCVHWWWDPMQHFMSFAQMRFRAPSGPPSLVWGACSGMVAPRTQSNLVRSGWHGAKLVIGKGFISLGQVLPAGIHCSWKCS